MARCQSDSLSRTCLPTVKYDLSYEFDDTVTGTPTAQLFVGGVADGSAVNGIQVAGNLYSFSITPTADATVGDSARIRLTATVGGSGDFVDIYSTMAQTANLIELDVEHVHEQQSIDENG